MAYKKRLPPPTKYADEPAWRGNSYDVGSRIVRAGWNLLFTKDPANLSLREVAQEVGVSAPAAYNHFRDREQLLGELAWGGLAMLSQDLTDVVPGMEFTKGMIPGICKAWLRFAEKRPKHYALMFSREFNDPQRHPLVVEKRRNHRLFIHHALAKELGFEQRATETDLSLALLHGAASLLGSGAPKLSAKVVSGAILQRLALTRKKGRSG